MAQIVNDCLTGLNGVGKAFCTYAGSTFVQSALLVLLLFAIDLLLRKRVRAVVRYCVWLLVLVKLVLPPTLALPTGIGYWLGARVPATSGVAGRPAEIVGFEAPRRPPPEPLPTSNEIPQSGPAAQAGEPAGPVAPAASSLTPVTWQTIVLLFWLAGVLAFAVVLVQRLRFVRGLVATSAPADGELLCLLDQCRRQIGVHRQVRLRTLDTLPSPAVCGLLKPVILMPTPLVERLAPEGLKAALIHELAHIRRGDLWINAVQTFLQVIYFYNPFVWFANAMIRRTCEEAVDETVLVTLGGRAKDYSNTLIDIGEMAFWKADFGLRLIGVAESRKALQWRIKHMLTRPVPQSARIGALGTIVILVVAAVLLPMAKAEKSTRDASVTPQVTGAGATEETPLATESDVLVDPKTGVNFVLAKTIAGANDVIEDQNRITMSPNGKFLLWNGRVVPLDGSPAFTLKELQGAGVDSWSASWSPDGQKIAFNSEGIEVLPISPETGRPKGAVRKLLEEKGGWHSGKIYWSTNSERILFVKRNLRMEREIGAITLRDARLNRQPDYADFGLVSPDGKTIAYSVPEDGIWTRPVNGGTPRIARAFYARSLFDDAEVWTSDSQWLASAVDGWLRNEIHFVRLVDGQGFDLSLPEAVGTFVGKSADGKKLRFYRSSFDLRTTSKVIPISGGPAFSVGPNYFWPEHYCWPPDSTSLAVLEMEKGGSQHLWSIPLIGGDRVQFNMESLGKDERYLYSLSPDSQKLLYYMWSGTDQGINLYVVPISLKEGRATGPATLAFKGWRPPNDAIGGKVGAWSPDGTKIAVPHQSDEGIGHLILFADGSRSMQLTQTANEVEQYPQWSPDSKRIAFNLRASDREMLQVIPAEGGVPRTIMTTPKGQSAPFGWSPDSKEVAVVCDGTISGFPIAGGSARVIVKLQDAGYESASWLGWSPDGQRLAFYGGKRGEASRLCLFSPNTGIVEKLENSPDTAQDFLWSPDSKMICCTAKEAEKVRPAGIIRELDVAEAVQKAPPVAERKPTEATAGPQAEPIAGPVFTDNFDNGPSKHWQFQDLPSEGPPAGHAVENGQLVLANARARLDGIDWTDYIVTVRLCLKESVASGEAVFGIEARATPSKFGSTRRDRYSLIILCINNAPRYLLLDINYADASDTLRHGKLSQSPCGLVRDQWYTLEFEIRGQQLRGYLDGKLVIEATDARLSKGGPLWLDTWRCRALFDDFSVRQLP